jgi:hypothetical protein
MHAASSAIENGLASASGNWTQVAMNTRPVITHCRPTVRWKACTRAGSHRIAANGVSVLGRRLPTEKEDRADHDHRPAPESVRVVDEAPPGGQPDAGRDREERPRVAVNDLELMRSRAQGKVRSV